ncbi:MAG: recombinase family protein, partial [Gammaproteobacteria bacterium]|nr:recombinase family protein [Gammaproteobacteria bacterium]
MKTAVIYARFSSAKQNEQSIDAQVRVCNKYAEDNNYKLVHTYIDRAASGMTDRRPQFRQMIRDSENGLFDVIIVYQYDRFARNRRDAINNKYTLKMNGVKLLSATEPEITDRPADLFLEGILDTAAEFYSRDLAQKTKRGMEESLAKGLSIGGWTQFGYQVIDKKYQVKEDDAKIVKMIFESYASGETPQAIAEELNRSKIKYFGKEFKFKTIYTLLDCRKYIGEYINPFTDEIMTNMYPPIITKELFNLVQRERLFKKEKVKMSPNYNVDRKYILTGKLFCGYCGENMTGVSGRSRNGKKYRYYVCNTPGCKKQSVRKELIEDIAVNEALNYLNEPVRKRFIVNDLLSKFKEARDNSQIKELEKEKKALTERLNKITDSFSDATGILRQELNKKAQALGDEIHELDREIVKLKILEDTKLYDKKFLEKWIDDVIRKDENNLYKAKAVNYFINSVFVFDDKAVVYLNFDDAEPITHFE